MAFDAQLVYKHMKKNATNRARVSPRQDSSTRVKRSLTRNYEARVVHIRNVQQD